MARFFIDRPIFAIVLGILICLAGTLAIFTLPIAQYPEIAPPSIQITASYAGASAQTVENTVVQVIEQQLSGLDHLLYISSNSDDSGTATVTATFAPGTDPDIAQVQTQNKLQLATPLLPQSVQQAGVRVTKSSNGLLLAVGFYSTDGSMSRYDIANYVYSHLYDPVSRIDGVGLAGVYGTQYAMRAWLDLAKLNNYGLTPIDVSDAIAAQNVQVAGGQLGGTPAAAGQQLTATITEATLLRTPQQFRDILLKVNPDGSQVRLGDVAKVELGAENYFVNSRYNGHPASGISVQPAPGSNALKTADAIRAKIEQMKPSFPPGLEAVYPYDTTPFVRASIKEVVTTLLEGIVLVFAVMYLFLQNLRATLIPTIAVPVVLLGTFGIMAAAGFSINTLSMFGMVLAIGLLVDDAIVVVENVERVMSEEGLGPHDATVKAMGQITGALAGVAVVLAAVFIPAGLSSGSVGQIYRQFSLTIVSAMALSIFVALSLTPALCAKFLKPVDRAHPVKTTGFFGAFNRGFDAMRERYASWVGRIERRYLRWLVVYGALTALMGALFVHLPSSFLPQEDQGVAYVLVQTPPGTTQERTMAVLEDVGDYVRGAEKAAVDATFEIAGINFAGRAQNQGLIFMHFRDWSQRKSAALGAAAVLGRIGRHFAPYPGAQVIPVAPPAVPGLGTSSGFDMELEDQAGLGHAALVQARDQLIALAARDPALALVRPNGLADNPTFQVDIDREKAAALGVSLADVDQTFSIAWGSKYVDNFLDSDARIKRVYVQADAAFRMNPEDLAQLYVRNAKGTMVQFSTFATGRWTWGSPKLERFNGVAAAQIQGQAAPGHSTGEAMAAMEKLVRQLPHGIGLEWTGVSLQERQAGSQAPIVYGLAMLVVFLALAALYESWSIPVSVLMVVPLGVLGAVAAATAVGLENDVFFQVGLLTTIGLSSKNAILIVEFARELEASGRPALDAALEAARLRLRPILMTSLAFVLGVLPLAIASGAGSAGENAVGRGVIGGMLTATFLAPLLVPMFFIVITEKVFKPRVRRERPATAAENAS